MTDWRMRIAFNGAAYAGWQRQVGLRTVQQSVEEALRSVFREKELTVTACGRTDAGVHALDMVLSFHSVNAPLPAEAAELLKRRLPHDVRLLELTPAPGFDAHADALGKAYVYVICPGEPEIFLRGLCWNWPGIEAGDELRRAVGYLIGPHDFRFFTGRKTEGRTVRTICRAELLGFGPLLCLYLSGDGFLYKMVRRLTGFLYEIARGERPADELADRLSDPVPPPDDITVAPPEGLYLKRVFYRPDEWREDRLTAPPFLLPLPGGTDGRYRPGR